MKSSLTVVLLTIVLVAGAVAGYFLATSRPNLKDDTGGTVISPTPTEDPLIVIDAPASGATVKSPLKVTGRARGNWYFEASFPIVLTDWDGRIISQTIAQAKGDWMTTDWVPFEATVVFEADLSVSSRGALILQKDNPSGEPQYDDSREITVFFGK